MLPDPCSTWNSERLKSEHYLDQVPNYPIYLIWKNVENTREFLPPDPDPDPAQLKKNPDPTPDPTFNRNEEKNIFIF